MRAPEGVLQGEGWTLVPLSLFTQQPPFCFSVLPKTCLLGVWPSFRDAPSGICVVSATR